jgi:hypothetical protein
MQYYALPRYSDTDVEYFSFDKVLAQKKYDETAGLLQRGKILIWEKTFWDSLTVLFFTIYLFPRPSFFPYYCFYLKLQPRDNPIIFISSLD